MISTLHPGDRAVYDSMRGLVTVVIVAVPVPGRSSRARTCVVLQATEARAGYAAGETFTAAGARVFAPGAVRVVDGVRRLDVAVRRFVS